MCFRHSSKVDYFKSFIPHRKCSHIFMYITFKCLQNKYLYCRNSGAPDNFVNTYQCPLETTDIGAAVRLQWTGYFTCSQIHRLFDELRYM
jgi:hypothetical protein